MFARLYEIKCQWVFKSLTLCCNLVYNDYVCTKITKALDCMASTYVNIKVQHYITYLESVLQILHYEIVDVLFVESIQCMAIYSTFFSMPWDG